MVDAKEISYTDAKSGQVVYAYHAKIDQLRADSTYLYGACTTAPTRNSVRSDLAAWSCAVYFHQFR